MLYGMGLNITKAKHTLVLGYGYQLHHFIVVMFSTLKNIKALQIPVFTEELRKTSYVANPVLFVTLNIAVENFQHATHRPSI